MTLVMTARQRAVVPWNFGSAAKLLVRKRGRRRCLLKRAEAGPPRECPEAASDGLEATLSEESFRPETRAAWEAWVLATLPRALAFATSLLRDRTLVEDVVHDCYVRLLEKAETYDLLNDGTKLLYKAITHACIDRNYRDRRLLSLEFEFDGEAGGALADGRVCDPRDLAEYRELEEALAGELGRLTVAQRGALELKSLGYSLEEIAEAIGTSPGNAGVLVHRARKALAHQLARFLERLPDE
jgi:RNA polymerase sigma factor (sigma-70 family)